MTAARANKELLGGTGKTWAQETDRRLRQALGLMHMPATLTTAQMWDRYLTQKGYVYGTYAEKIAQWQRVEGTLYPETYAALSLLPATL